MWAQIAMAAVNILAGNSAAKNQAKSAKADYEYRKGQETIVGINRASANIQRMTQANAQRAQQWRDNHQIMKRTGAEFSQSAYNFGLQKNQVAGARFENQIANMGNLGSITAQAAASGVGGASVEQLSMTEQLRQDRMDATFGKSQEQLDYAQRMSASAIIDNGFNSLDMSMIYSDLDYTPQGLVLDNSGSYKYSLGKATMDGVNGASGNMNNLGINIQQSGFQGPDWFNSTSKDNGGIGGRSTKTGANGFQTGSFDNKYGALRL